MIIYTRKFLKYWQQGRCLGPIIIIDPEFKGNKPLIDHEKHHRKQFYKFGLLGILMTYILPYGDFEYLPIIYALSSVSYFILRFIPRFRYEMELQAYRKQIRVNGEVDFEKRRIATYAMTHYYNLNAITYAYTRVYKDLG